MLDNPSYLLADGLAPLIIFGLIIFIQFLFKSLTSKGDAADSEAAEAEAKHREELREKIRSRMEAARQANQGKPASPQTIVRDILEEAARPRMQEPTVVKAPEPIRETLQPSVFAPEDPMAAIQKRIEVLKQQGMDAQHKVEAIQSEANIKKRSGKHFSPAGKTCSLKRSLKDSLSNPRSAQQAILLAEVLGKPKGLQ